MSTTATPTVIATGYDGALLVTLQWDPGTSGPYFVTGVLDAAGTVVGRGTGFGAQGTVRLSAPLTDGVKYYGAAAADDDGQQGPWGTTMELVTTRLTSLAADYDGGSSLDVRWTLPRGALANGATVTAVDASTGNELATAVLFGGSGRLPLPGPLAPGDAYALLASATFATSTGPPTTLPLVSAPAALAALEYDPGAPKLEAQLQPPVPDGAGAGIALFADGGLVQSATGVGILALLRLPAKLDPGVAWSVRPYWSASTARGPYGPETAVVVEAPRLRSVRWEGAELVLAWENAPGPPYPTGAQVEVRATGETTRGFVSSDPAGARFVPSPALLPGSAYTVTVAALRGSVQGPDSAPLPVIAGSGALSGASYDGRTVGASWSATPPPGATGARLLVRESGQVVAQVVAGSGAARVEVPLVPGSRCDALLVWTAGPVDGPLGTPVTLIADAPLLTSAVVAGTNVTLAWSGPQAPAGAVTGLQAVFSSPGFAERTVAITAAQPTIAFAAPSSDPLVPVTVAMRAVGTAATGPAGNALALLRDAPAVTAVEPGAGGALHVAWSAVPDPAEAYVATLTRDGAPIATQTVPATATSATLAPGAVVAASVYAVHVLARAGGASGPAATATTAVLTPPAIAAVGFDGSALSITVTAPGGGAPTPDRYELELLRDGRVVQQATVAPPAHAGDPLLLPVAAGIDRDADFAVTVRAGSGVARGPLASAAALLAAPRVEQLSYAGQLVATVLAGAQPVAGLTLSAGLWVDGTLSTTTPLDGDGRARFDLPDGRRFEVAARGRRGGADGPWSEHVTALTTAPILSSARYDGEQLVVAWTSTAGCDLTVSGPHGTVAAGHGDGGGAMVAFAALAAGDYMLTVTPRAGRASGPHAAARLMTAAPAVAQVVADPLGDGATVGFSAVTAPRPSGYEVQLLRDGLPLGPPIATTTTSAPLPGPLAGQGDLAVAVRAHAADGALSLTGPYGPALPIPTASPPAVTVDFDGLTARVGWEPVAGASGYHASVVASGHDGPVAQLDAAGGARELRLPVTLPDTTSAWQLALQARAGASSGPAARVPLFAPGLYLRTDGQPRLFHAATLARTPAPVTAYLPQIGPLRTLPLPPASRDPLPFQLAANGDAASRAAFPYTLTIAGPALDFSSGAAVRADVWSAAQALLTAAELDGATPWGIVLLQQTIARLLPQTFAETLLYSYGLAPDGASADLRPGLVLRVASSEFDLMPSNRPPAWSEGYAGGATADYEIGDYLDVTPQPDSAPWQLGFDAFVSWLAANGTVTVASPQTSDGSAQSGAAEAADLYYPAARQPFQRLFLPSRLLPSTAPATGLPAQQFTLAAAATYAAISGAGPRLSPGVAVSYFRGRTVVKLAIRIAVDGCEQLVPLGTTVGNVLDRVARRPPRAATALHGLTLERSRGPVVLDPAAYEVGASARVRLDWGGLATFDRRDALSLPLLHGDRLTLGAGS